MANVIKEETIQYLQHDITATVLAPGETCAVRVKRPDGSRVTFTEYVDPVLPGTQNSGIPSDKDEYHSWLLMRASGRARGAIVLESVAELDKERFSYLPPEPVTVPESELELVILQALRIAKRLDPQHLGYVPLDAMGICTILNLEYDAFNYSNQRLIDRNHVEITGAGWDRLKPST
ncbi:MAG: hypothetical protein IIB18_05250 [Chloroflexi bacterium]|nr:hypothetical protein [Chloroflexota bacterium]